MEQTVNAPEAMADKKKMSPRQRKRHIQNLILLTPQFIIFLTLVIIPLFVAIPFLFSDMSNFLDPRVNFIGFDNFTRLFTDSNIAADYWPGLVKTIRFTILNYAMVYVFGLTLALLMYEVGFRGGLFTMIYLPWMVSGLALGFIALMLFSESTGTVNLLLEKWGIIKEPFNIKSEEGTTIVLPVLVGWKAAGFNMAIFLTGLLSIPKDTIEAAIVDGASYMQRLRWIYFPQMIPSFVIATIFALMGSFKVFDELVAMGGLYQNDAAEFLSIIFFRYGFTQNKLSLAMTLAVQTFLPLMIIAIFLQFLQRRATVYQD
ncbi:MAG: sugar ABC transporter permease [Chloroflexota bacterium]|nr:sugar ABC transporter permease [Chloroflexota bacterium]